MITYRRGFSFIELCICLAILAMVIPVLISVYLSIQSYLYQRIQFLLKQSEWDYMAMIMQQDLIKGALDWRFESQFFISTTPPIIYSLDSGTLKRYVKRTKRLNSSLKLKTIHASSEQCIRFIFERFPAKHLCKEIF